MLDSAAASSRFFSGIDAMSHTEPGGWGVNPIYGLADPAKDRSVLRWRPGLDVTGDAELIHYLMMRAVQEQKDGRGSTSLGADLGGSYDFFREKKLARMQLGDNEDASRYLGWVQRAVSGDSHEHPKVAVTADRAFRAWREGDKTLVFCFNIATVDAVRDAVKSRIDTYITEALTAAFKCKKHEVKRRFKNFRKRLYNNRQSVFLLFLDYPLAGPKGRLSARPRPSQARHPGGRRTARTRWSTPGPRSLRSPTCARRH